MSDLVVERSDVLSLPLAMHESSAVFSADRTYRYRLTRRWTAGPLLGWVMLNPSTADAFTADPTITRCLNYALSWGYAGIDVTNLFALRSTDPKALRDHPDPVGPANDQVLADRDGIGPTVCAWGAHGTYLKRAQAVLELLAGAERELWAIGLTKAGHPAHPLYQRNDARAFPYPPREVAP